jgi:hypothetical protein
MKLSKNTISVIQNFSTINPSMYFLEGQRQRILSQLKTVYAEAEIEEELPSSFALYDVPKFLSILSLFSEPEITITDKQIILKENGQKATYRFCNPDLIVHPPVGKEIPIGEIVYSFELSAENLKTIMKAVNLYDQETIAIKADGEKILLTTLNVKDSGSDGLSFAIGETNQSFQYVIRTDSMKMLNVDYDVQISKSKALIFTSKNSEHKVKYIIPSESNYSSNPNA